MILDSIMQKGKAGIFNSIERSANLMSAKILVSLQILLSVLSVIIYYTVKELKAGIVFLVFSIPRKAKLAINNIIFPIKITTEGSILNNFSVMIEKPLTPCIIWHGLINKLNEIAKSSTPKTNFILRLIFFLS